MNDEELMKEAKEKLNIKGEFREEEDKEELLKRIEKLEITCHAYWLMLKGRGFTSEEFDASIAEAVGLSKHRNYKIPKIVCPQCGMNAQLSGYFKIKCIYCGNEVAINPYEIYTMFEEEEAQAAQAAPDAPVDDPFTPYDVTKDLNFDEV
ncbi:MAG: hypothetical protein II718_08150 [Clostridiales bacterium]|nr:hypothetical protein [Clostridiales bacterium]